MKIFTVALFFMLFVAGSYAHSVRSMLQATTTTQQQQQQQRPIRINAPASESQLFNFELQGLTPTAEVMQESNNFLGALNNPQQFSQLVSQSLSAPNGLVMTAAAFSDLIARGQARELVNALNQLNTQQGGVASQVGGQQQMGAQQFLMTQPATAYALAVVDRMSRMDFKNSGQAIFWALSGLGGSNLAQQTVAQLDAFQSNIGCSDPLRSALANAGTWAQQQSQTTTTPGSNTLSTFVSWMQSSPSLLDCWQSSFPQAQSLIQQATGGGAQGAGGMQGTAGVTGTTAGQGK